MWFLSKLYHLNCLFNCIWLYTNWRREVKRYFFCGLSDKTLNPILRRHSQFTKMWQFSVFQKLSINHGHRQDNISRIEPWQHHTAYFLLQSLFMSNEYLMNLKVNVGIHDSIQLINGSGIVFIDIISNFSVKLLPNRN